MSTTIVLAEGDLLPEIEMQFTDATGQAVDISSATSRKLYARKLFTPGDPLIDAEDLTVVDAVEGRAKYVPQGDDTAAPGVYRVRAVVTFAGSKAVSWPNGKPLTMVVNRRI
jgi:hypothetical protein